MEREEEDRQVVIIRKQKGEGKLAGEEESEKIEKKKSRMSCRARRLVSYDELPDYMKENEFIHRHYRAEWPLLDAALSLFSWHNETINIWTHLLGFLLFLGLTAVQLSGHTPRLAGLVEHLSWPTSSKSAENASSSSAAPFLMTNAVSLGATPAALAPPPPPVAVRWPFFIFLAGSMFCLLSSSACHLMSCHSHRLNLFLIRLDYAGIAVMIVASFFPPIYYLFQCEPHWQAVYLSVITAAGVATAIILLSPHLSSGKFRGFRSLLFAGMGLSGIVPAVHAAVINWNEPRWTVTVAYELAMAVSYLTGTAFYVSRVPERWRPGWFDIAGHSHQIFHLFVIGGALAHYGAALIFLRYRDEVGCGAGGR